MASSAGPDPYEAPKVPVTIAPPVDRLAYVGFWARVVGFMIDFVILFSVAYVFGFLDLSIDATGAVQYSVPDWAIVAYFLLFWLAMATTPGKRLLGGRIVDARTGGRAAWWRFIVRLLMQWISGLVLFLGFVWIAFDSKKRGWHDLVAGTVVIRSAATADEPTAPAGEPYRCGQCGHRVWTLPAALPEHCGACGRGSYEPMP